MQYYLVPRGVSAPAANFHLGCPFSTKIAKNRKEDALEEYVALGVHQSMQSAPKGPQSESKISKMSSPNRFEGDFWPNGLTFIEHAQAPGGLPLLTFSNKKLSKRPLRKYLKNTR